MRINAGVMFREVRPSGLPFISEETEYTAGEEAPTAALSYGFDTVEERFQSKPPMGPVAVKKGIRHKAIAGIQDLVGQLLLIYVSGFSPTAVDPPTRRTHMRDHDNARKEHFSLGCQKVLGMGSGPFGATALLGLRAIQECPNDHCDAVPIWHSFDLLKDRVEEDGWTREVSESELLSPQNIVGIKARLKAGSSNELHCRTTDQWAYLLRGNARVTIMDEFGLMFIGDVSEGDILVLPAGYSHSIQGLSRDGTEILLIFPQGSFSNNESSFFRSGWPTS